MKQEATVVRWTEEQYDRENFAFNMQIATATQKVPDPLICFYYQ